MSDSNADAPPFSRARSFSPTRDEAPTSRPPLTERIERASATYERVAKPYLVLLFIVLLVVPAFFTLGPIKLTFPRFFLLIMFVPLIFRWLMGRYGGILLPDLLLVGHAIWHFFVISFHHGVAKASEFSSVAAVELLGAYFLARIYIRDRASFVFFLKCSFWTLVVLMPFAVIESLTRTTPIIHLIDAIPGLEPFKYVDHEQRLGLNRAQVTFEHPILFGVFCSALFGVSWYVLARPNAGIFSRGMSTFIPFLGTFVSLSSGALVAIMVQLMLIGWDLVTKPIKKRWNVLALIFLTFYVTIDLLSNRTPAQIFVSFGTFNASSAYNRILIWNYGSAEVIRNPILGLGLKDWQRPAWMVASTDNYWLLVAMRYGMPGFLLMTVAFFLVMRGVAKMDFSDDPEMQACQKGYLITLFGVFVAMITVHMWGGTFLFVIFFLASGAWMYTGSGASTIPARRRAVTERGEDSDGETSGRQHTQERKSPTRRDRTERPSRRSR